MGIDYVIDLACEAKETLSIERIVEMTKMRSRAETILAMAREDGDRRAPSQITFQVAVNRNGRIAATDVSCQELLDQAAPLEMHRAGCASCAANRGSPRGYGCYDGVSYPIEADTERILLSRLPDDLESAAGFMFAAAMRDFAWDGAQAREMRAQGETFFRLREPPVRRWSSGLSISGDQLFHMMFHVGHVGASHAKMLCLFFGMIRVGDERESARPTTIDVETDNARQMFALLNAFGFAAQHGLDVLVDG
jgi:hypothetical protein